MAALHVHRCQLLLNPEEEGAVSGIIAVSKFRGRILRKPHFHKLCLTYECFDSSKTQVCMTLDGDDLINHLFPPSINIKWSKNGKIITVENHFKKCLSNPDGTFHILSTLNFIPQKGDIYGCTVEHEALEEPLTRFWGETNFYINTF
ncbi:H-2 class II histocompatibility antigen, A-S beta chain-like [Pelmatolapia mariae]|uniref:H-2 class II histocompatibility antigen, A-S beta chain-like n=1 Tax=Pelmatolapia mariae TaxID=158779 RepID=UPI003211D42D